MSQCIFFSINCTALWFSKSVGKLDIGTGLASLSVKDAGLIAKLKTVCEKYKETNVSFHGRYTVFLHLMLLFGLAC